MEKMTVDKFMDLIYDYAVAYGDTKECTFWCREAQAKLAQVHDAIVKALQEVGVEDDKTV